MRIGIVGTENSHADHYVRHFNSDERYPPHRITALAGGRGDRNDALADAGRITDVVDAASDLIGRVAAAIVCSRDPRLHRELAVPLLTAGLPVLVDKPLASDLDDARAILAAASVAAVPVTSYSALRWAAPVRQLQAALPTLGPLELLTVSGPADPDSEYAGLFFYGVHVAEIALQLLGGRLVERIQVGRTDDPCAAVVCTGVAGQARVVLDLVRPGEHGSPPWRVIAAGPNGQLARTITLGPDYTEPATAVCVDMLATGRAPLTEQALLAPVALLAEITGRLADTG
jgi:predicted dehydrogenase